jgi:hypothetical protein
MKGKPNYYTEILVLLKDLHLDYPSYSLSKHLATAFSEYRDIWGISNRELLESLKKYKNQLDLDTTPEQSIDKIIEEGTNLEKLFKKDLAEGEEDWESY